MQSIFPVLFFYCLFYILILASFSNFVAHSFIHSFMIFIHFYLLVLVLDIFIISL